MVKAIILMKQICHVNNRERYWGRLAVLSNNIIIFLKNPNYSKICTVTSNNYIEWRNSNQRGEKK